MTDVSNKFGDWIKEGFDLYKNNLGVLILSSLIAVLLTWVSLGILSGPMMAGMILIVFRLRDKTQPPPSAGDVFQGFQYFLPSFLFCIVWGLILVAGNIILSFIPCIGTLLSICLSFALSAFLMFGLFLIVDRKMDFWPASMASFEKVKPAFFPFLGLAVVASIISQIGAIACGIGIFITFPIYHTILAVTYRDVFGDEASSPAPASFEPPPPPPEPPGDTAGDTK